MFENIPEDQLDACLAGIEIVEAVDNATEGRYTVANVDEFRKIIYILTRYCEAHDGILEAVLIRTSTGLIEISLRLREIKFHSRDEYLGFLYSLAYVRTVNIGYIGKNDMRYNVILDGLCGVAT